MESTQKELETSTFVGVIQEASEVDMKISGASWECLECGTLTRIPQWDPDTLESPHKCQGCEESNTEMRINKSVSDFNNYQEITFFGGKPSDTSPRSYETGLIDDLAGSVQAGDFVKLKAEITPQHKDGSVYQENIIIKDVQPTERPDWLSTNDPPEDLKSDLIRFCTRARIAISTLKGSPHEIATRTKIITPFLRTLGWQVESDRFLADQIPVSIDSNRRPDYLLLDKDKIPGAVVEAKSYGKYLEGDATSQIKDNMRAYSVDRGILTDGSEYRLFFRESPNDPEVHLLARITLDDLDDYSPVVELFTPESVGDRESYLFNGDTEELEEIFSQGSIDMETIESWSGWLAPPDVLEKLRPPYTHLDDDSELEAKELLRELQEENDPVPHHMYEDEMLELGFDREEAENQLQKLKDVGDVYCPEGEDGHYRLF